MGYHEKEVHERECLMMTDKMKLGLVFGGMVVAFVIQMILGSPADANISEVNDGEGLRLRVIAHSDDAFDQVVKRVVVFAIEDFLNQHEAGLTADFIITNLDGIRNSIDTVMAEIDVEMDVQISLEHHYFVDSLGYYTSLVVKLGEGLGENWWCFINPGVCTVPNDEDISSNEAQVEVLDDLQESFGMRASSFIGGLFGGGSNRQEVAEGEINWFLFDDEKK